MKTGDERLNKSSNDNISAIDSSKFHPNTQISNSDKVWTSLAAGAFAGALAKTTIAPLDRTKIYFQTSAKVVYSARSAYEFLAKSYKSDGFLSLWRGNSATMARIIPYASVQFTAHEQWKQILQVDHNVHHGNTEEVLRFLSGALAGITAQSLTYPLDMTRARLAIASKAKYRTLRETFEKIYRQEGIFTLYRGYTATMMGVIPYAGMSFYVYETLKKKWAEMGHPMTPLSRLCFGAMAGVLGQTSSYPLDIVRRRLQVTEKTKGQKTGIIHILLKVARTGDERLNKSSNDNISAIDSSKFHPNTQISNSDKVWTSLAAGAFAGALAKTTIAPLDRTKIYFQTSAKVVYSARSAYEFLAKSYKSDGFLSLWRGNSATMARIIPYASVQFTAHEQWKQILQVDHNVHHGNTEEVLRFLSGALAGITAQSLTYPLDMTRARLAIASKAKYRTLRETFEKIYRQEGIFTLYRGYTATMMGVIPYAGMSFYVYETLKKKWAEMGHPMTPLSRLCFGAMAGVLGQSSSYPLDIVRRRLQVTEKTKGQKTGIIHILLKVAREEGVVKGLYKGLSMNWVKGPVAAGISFSVFDLTQNFLRSHITQK